jgi:hypothetical protein
MRATGAGLVIASPAGAWQSPDNSAEIAASGKNPPRNDGSTMRATGAEPVIASPTGAWQSPDNSAEIAASGKSPPRNDRSTW